MNEKTSGIVNIKDIKPEVVKEMIYLIYNGAASSGNVMNEIGKDLLGAADQFNISFESFEAKVRGNALLHLGG